MGCKYAPYWIGTFLFDYLVFYLVYIFFIIFGYIEYSYKYIIFLFFTIKNILNKLIIGKHLI